MSSPPRGKAILALVLLLFSFPAALFASVNQAVNAVIGDASFLAAYGRAPDPGADEDLRIRTHLRFVERLLRSDNASVLDPDLAAARRRNLDLLAEYTRAEVFPRNHDYPGERRPCFIDRDGRICAVGYLVERTAGRALAEEVNREWQYDYLLGMESPRLASWAASSGLTPIELALIQPCYGCPQMYECLRITARAWSAGTFPPGETLDLVGIGDPTSAILDSPTGEVTLYLGELVFEDSWSSSFGTFYHYRAGSFSITSDPQRNAAYANLPPNSLTPGTFLEGEALLTGKLHVTVYIGHGSPSSRWLGASGELTGGSLAGGFEIPSIELSGSLTSAGAPGYALDSDMTLIGACGPLLSPVEAATWGSIKAAFR